MNDRSIAMDTETTGLSYKDGDRVIEIGCVEIIGNMPTDNHFHMFINPGRRKVNPEAIEIHGITDEFLADKPQMHDVMPKFLEFIGDSPLIIHNASFDTGMLNNELELLQKAKEAKGMSFPQKLPNEIVDTLHIARRLYPMSRNSLDALCTRFNIDRSQRTLHGALVDSWLLAQVYIEMMGYNRLDLGDHPLRQQAMNMAIESLVSTTGSRPVRPARPAVFPSESEATLHSQFVDKKIKDAIWGKYY